LVVFLFSMAVNALMLTGPLYMLQVYDRVLGSRSEETLLALTLLIAFLFLMMGILDHLRGRVMARVGARFQATLDGRVFQANLRRAAMGSDTAQGKNALRDLESVQRFLSSPAFLALCDIPWTPLFIFVIFILHPWLGILACLGGTLLIIVTIVNQYMTKGPMAEANTASARAEMTALQLGNEAELVASLGMRGAAFQRWMQARGNSLTQSIAFSDRSGFFTVTTKTLRLFLQSAMLGLGAYLVLQNEMTAGAMIAGSILLGRALAPIELAIGQWQVVNAAQRGWAGLVDLLDAIPPETERTPLPRPVALLQMDQATIIPPGARQAALKMCSFTLQPGTALGVIGPSGAGKSTLARAITGSWPPAGGKIRLDTATLDQYDPDVLGSYIGYLPQKVSLFDGTIADNIARLSAQPDPAKIVEAARKAAAHEMITALPQGYDTLVSATGSLLSGGQIQRIGLARAMYGNPVILVLDEPNSNLDNEGTIALNSAVRTMKADGSSIVIIAHRPDAIRECEMLLVLEKGARAAFGPRDEVLQKMVKNAEQIQTAQKPGGVA
jgi:ATP-binding cassette subfamily C protein